MKALNTHRSGAVLMRLLIAIFAALLLGAVSVLPAVAAGTWTTTGSLNTARDLHTATLLQNGQVLVAGGESFNGTTTKTLASTELYHPSTGSWTTTGSLNVARDHFTITLLNNGNVLAAGGYYYDPVQGPIALASAELYTPATGTWTYTGSLHTARWNHSATLLQNGEVLVAGGESFSGTTTNTFASAELYDPATGTWTTTGSLHTARYEQTATLLTNGQVLVAGGNTGVFVGLASAELYDPATGTWKTTGSMRTVRRGHTMTLLANGQVLVAGGADSAGTYLASAELYDPAHGKWTATGTMNQARESHTATLLTSGQVLVAGGYDSGYFASAELYDPGSSTWTTTGSMNVAHASHTATLLTGDQVLVAGGESYNGYTTATSELYTP
jgi:N-acetylneuraminic acid mutarotase